MHGPHHHHPHHPHHLLPHGILHNIMPHHPHHLLPHGILHNIMPHNPIVHHLLRPNNQIAQNVNINVYEQPQPSNQYNYEEPYYDEKQKEQAGIVENTPMSTAEYFRLKALVEQEWEKEKEKKNDDKKKTEDIKEKNNITQQPPLNSLEKSSTGLQPAPPSNQQPVDLPTLNDILTNK